MVLDVTALGVTFDRSLKWDNFVSKTVSSSNFHLCALHHLRSTLGPKLCATVAWAVALSKLDYCNSLFCGASAENIDRLQKVQNKLARVATGSPRRSHITPVLASLHWLPGRQRIIYKVASIIYKARSTKSPPYLQSILQDYILGRSVRSDSRNLICERRTKTATGARAFSVVVSKIWHDLPDSIRSSDPLRHLKRT